MTNNILHLSNVMGDGGGGVAQVVESLVCSHANRGEECHLWYAGTADLTTSGIHNNNLIKTREIGSDNYVPLSLFYEMNRILSAGSLIHQHGVFKPISLLTISAKKEVKRVISPHGYLEPEKMLNSRIKKKLAMCLYEWHNLRSADCLIACSHQEAEHLRNLNIETPIAIVPNSVSPDVMNADKSKQEIIKFKNKLQLDRNTKILGFLSRIHEFKGLRLLIKVIGKMREDLMRKNWIFLIAGISENGHEDELKKVVNDMALTNLIKFVGPQFGSEKITFFDALDCFILPTRGENFGIVIAEALARGVPVITTKNTPWKILCEENFGWWVERNENSLMSVLNQLISKQDLDLFKMGALGKVYVQKNYSQTSTFEQLHKIYQLILKEKIKRSKNEFICVN